MTLLIQLRLYFLLEDFPVFKDIPNPDFRPSIAPCADLQQSVFHVILSISV